MLFTLVGLALVIPFISRLKLTNPLFNIKNLSVNSQFLELLHLTLRNKHPEINHYHDLHFDHAHLKAEVMLLPAPVEVSELTYGASRMNQAE